MHKKKDHFWVHASFRNPTKKCAMKMKVEELEKLKPALIMLLMEGTTL